MLFERLQTILHKENVPFNVNELRNLGPMQCFSRGSKQHFTGKKSGNSGNVVWTTSGHALYICIYQVLHVNKNVKLSAARHCTHQPVKLLVGHYLENSHAMLPKPMQSWPAISVKCRNQDCISNYNIEWNGNTATKVIRWWGNTINSGLYLKKEKLALSFK